MASPCITGDSRTPYAVVQLISDYWQFVTQYYVKHGRPTSEQVCIRSALRGLRQAFGRLEAKDFIALRLQELREHWIQRGLARYCSRPQMTIPWRFRIVRSRCRPFNAENGYMGITVKQLSCWQI